ncbi:MAG: hypothetical protein ACRDP9_14465 [Kribbellaceae bacterium]|nr:hypothetical protein [Kribbellaceae bacterium]
MGVRLNKRAYEHSQQLIAEDRVVLDERDDWSEHRPTAEAENAFIREHGLTEYQKWYLGIDENQDEDNKGRYKFPYGDFRDVHRCGLLAAESRAGQYKYIDIEVAVAHLHGMLDSPRNRRDRR